MKASWDRQADETEEWYERFTLYLYMGPKRTVTATHGLVTRVAQGLTRSQASTWQRAARRHHWQERAADFDSALGQKALAGQANLGMVAELLQQVYGVLQRAELPDLSKEEARQLLPQLRLFFRDLLRLHQAVAAQALSADQESNSGAALHADDLLALMSEGDGWQQVIAEMQRTIHMIQETSSDQHPPGAQASASEESWRPLRDALAQLYPDETSARRIAAQAQLDVARIHFSPRAVDSWHAILTEAAHAGQVERVIEATQEEYGANPELAQAVQRFYQRRAPRKTTAQPAPKTRRTRRKA